MLLEVGAMIANQRVHVVIPAHNEARLVANTVRSMPDYLDALHLVDDASEDGTSRAALEVRDARLRVHRHAVNRGVGAAILTGYRAAFAEGADHVVVMAGDGQMDPRDLPALLAPLLSGEADYAKGDRLSWPGAASRMPLSRYVGNHALSALTRGATGIDVRDSQCGYTALARRGSRALLQDGFWERYGYPNDLLGLLALAGARVVDVPVRPIYGAEQSGVGWRHALFVVPYVLGRVALRRGSSTLRPRRAERACA